MLSRWWPAGAQGLDKGILFSTYTLLIAQSTSGKELGLYQKDYPHWLENNALTNIHAKHAYAESKFAEKDFGGRPRYYTSTQMVALVSCFMLHFRPLQSAATIASAWLICNFFQG
jgi:hypothetical protein